MVFLHLKLFLPQEYIAPCECFSIFHWRISIFVWVENNIYLKNIRLCTSVFNCFCWRIPLCELTVMVMPSLEYFFYLKNIHLCMSVFQCLLLKNTFVWVDSNGIAFTWICFLPEEYTPLYKSTKTVFSTLEKKIIQRIYASVWVDKNVIFYT